MAGRWSQVGAVSVRKRQIVEIQEDQSNAGSTSESWVTRQKLYASVHDVRGGEVFRGVQLEANVDLVVEINYHAWVDPKMRVRHEGRNLNIDAMLDREQRKRDLELHCSRVADDG